MVSELKRCQIADALEKCDWAGASIGNKLIVLSAIEALRKTRPAPVATPADATDEMVEAALAVDWDNEDERATVHNIWHAMTAKLTSSPAATDTGLETVAWESMDNKLDPNDKLVYEVKFPRNGDKRLVYKSQAEELLAEKDIIIRSHLTTIASLEAKLAAGRTTFHLEWLAGARPPIHPEPMTGRLSFNSFDEAITFMKRQASDAQFVSLTERTIIQTDEDRSPEARAALSDEMEQGN